MIEIIKRGTKAKADCRECGAVLRYEASDVQVAPTGVRRWIDCPQCEAEIVLVAKR